MATNEQVVKPNKMLMLGVLGGGGGGTLVEVTFLSRGSRAGNIMLLLHVLSVPDNRGSQIKNPTKLAS